jgi:hypothetical protein
MLECVGCTHEIIGMGMEDQSNSTKRIVAGGLFALFVAFLVAALTVFGVISTNLGHIFMVAAALVGALIISTEIIPSKPPRHKIIFTIILWVAVGVADYAIVKYKKAEPTTTASSGEQFGTIPDKGNAEANSSGPPQSTSNPPPRKSESPHSKDNKPGKEGASGSQTTMRATPAITAGVKQASKPIQSVPVGPAPTAQSQPKPELSCPSSGKLTHHWALDKTQDRWTVKLSIVDGAVGYPLQQKIALMGFFDLPVADADLSKKAESLLTELHLNVGIPTPTKLKTPYGDVKNQEIQEEMSHEINDTLKLSWSCLNLVNGTPQATCGASKEVPIAELSAVGRDAIEKLDRFAKIQVDAKCLEAMRELTGSGN